MVTDEIFVLELSYIGILGTLMSENLENRSLELQNIKTTSFGVSKFVQIETYLNFLLMNGLMHFNVTSKRYTIFLYHEKFF